ncbi:hypothetical protein [Williamsia sp. 1135]|uniref:hypothetical protein n=1 Tax=Williamsia sp. 1135 TaxID=1889262 RepID=UPI000A0F7050|nr:hypothetical protein [Williamsia sp. 1135]ORM30563.1 hypothetical protein BFL43_18135 [Williamsia sp. 1135]
MSAPTQQVDSPIAAEREASAVTAMLVELRGLAQTRPTVARAATWQYIKELGDRNDLPALRILFGEGTAPDGPDGKLEGLIVGNLFGIPEAYLANPLMRINPTWQGKTFDLRAGTGFNRLASIARLAMPIVAVGYRGLRRGDGEVEGFDFDHSIEEGRIEPRVMVRALDYGVPAYKNPSVRTFPIKRTRDEIVEIVPGVYLGRALLTMRSGEVRLIAHFALLQPIGSPL